MKSSVRWTLIVLTPIFILLSHYLAMFPHEYAHSFTAWLLGYKANPFLLNYGGTNLLNILLLANVDENVNYQMIYSTGHGFHMALIAFAGPGIANGLLFILSLYLLNRQSIQHHPYLFYFLFWFNLMNLGNFFDYVPIRTFSTHDDMANIAIGLNISPWWIYIIFGYLVAFLIWQFFTKTLILAYKNLALISTSARASLMITSVLILFGYFGGIIHIILLHPAQGYGDISNFLSITSFLAIPGIIVALWPTRAWVEYRLKALSR